MNKYPYEVFTVQGTQGEKKNQLVLAKLSKMHKTKYDDDSEDWEDE
jgi:ribosome assembly protein RRB1